MHNGTVRSPFPCVAYVKNCANLQSKSVTPSSGDPLVQSPSPFPVVGENSVAVTLNVIVVEFTVGIVSASECAFGSTHGFPGPGFAVSGQSNVTILETFVP